MKRKATLELTSKAKRPKEPEKEIEKDYCDVATQKDDVGDVIWPAPVEAIESARSYLRAW